jgi:glycosyltransferase involved in cell wall biosynthesis
LIPVESTKPTQRNPKTPRVLFLTQTHAVWGGMEVWLHNLTEWLQSNGWDITVALAKGARYNDPKAYLRAHPHMRPLIMDASVGNEESRIQAIVDACGSCSPDLVVPINVGAALPAVERLKRRKVPIRLLLAVHSTNIDYLQNIKDYIESVDQVVGISRLIEEVLQSMLPHDAHRISYIRHGVPDPVIRRDRKSGPLRLGFVGRIHNESKRVFDLVTLAEHLIKNGTPCELHIFGDGENRKQLESELLPYRGEHFDVTFHGYMGPQELYISAYPELDVSLMFSDRGEGSPLVLFESMRHGVIPVVSRFIGHAAEGLIRHGINSLTFPIGDLKLAAELINRLAIDSDLTKKLSDQCIEDTAFDTVERMNRDWAASFERACKLPPRNSEISSHAVGSFLPSGRLDRLGLPPRMTNSFRALLGRRFPHRSGFEEWPGTQPVSQVDANEVERLLLNIEAEHRAAIYAGGGDMLYLQNEDFDPIHRRADAN